MASGLANKTGWLHKLEDVLAANPSWQRLFFHVDVTTRVMYSFFSDTDCAQFLRHGTASYKDKIELHASAVYTGVDYCEDASGELKYFVELTTPAKSHFFASPNVNDIQEWVTVLTCSNCNVALLTPDREVYFQVYAPRTALRGRYGFLRKRGRLFNKSFKRRFFRTLENASGEWVLAYYQSQFDNIPAGEPFPLNGATFYVGDLHVNSKATPMLFSNMDMLLVPVDPVYTSANGSGSATPDPNADPVYLFSIKSRDGRILCLEANSAFDVREWCEALRAASRGCTRPEIIDVLARQDLYALLGISSDADTEQIASAFQTQATLLGLDVGLTAAAIAAAAAAGKDYYASLGDGTTMPAGIASGATGSASSVAANSPSAGSITTTAARLVLAHAVLMQPKKRTVYDKLRAAALAATEKPITDGDASVGAPTIIADDAAIAAEARLREFERSPTVFLSNYAAEFKEFSASAAAKAVRHRLTIAATEEAEEKMTEVSIAGAAALALQGRAPSSQPNDDDDDDEFGVGRRPLMDSDEGESEDEAPSKQKTEVSKTPTTPTSSTQKDSITSPELPAKPVKAVSPAQPESSPKVEQSGTKAEISTSKAVDVAAKVVQPVVSSISAATVAAAVTTPTTVTPQATFEVVKAVATAAGATKTAPTTVLTTGGGDTSEEELQDLDDSDDEGKTNTKSAASSAPRASEATIALLEEKLPSAALNYVLALSIPAQEAVAEFVKGAVLIKMPHGLFAKPSETRFTLEYDAKETSAPWCLYWDSKKGRDEACVRLGREAVMLDLTAGSQVFTKATKIVATHGKENCISLLAASSSSPLASRGSLEVVFPYPDPRVRDGFVSFLKAVLGTH